MRTAMIYPFSARSLPLVLFFSKFQPEYEVTALVSPPGLGLAGHSPLYAANRNGNSTLIVQSDIEAPLNQCDAIIVPFGDHKNDPSYCDVISVIHRAAMMGKEIFCCLKLSNSQRRELTEVCKSYGASWHDGIQEPINVFKQVSYGEYQVHTPVVFVQNLGIEADSFEITLSLAHKLRSNGYRVSVIGANPEYNILGLHGSSLLFSMLYGHEFLKNIPRFISLLQLYFHMIEVKESPDVILLHCPGAVLPMKGVYQNDNGVYTFILTRAIRPDFSLMCMSFGSPTIKEIQIINEELMCRFGFGMDTIHLSNRALHVDAAKYQRKEQYFFLPEEYAINNAANMNSESPIDLPVFCALNDQGLTCLYAHIIKTLG